MVFEKRYGFNEAVDLAGTGFYNIYLVVTLSLIYLSTTLDMFGISVIVQLSSCDFQLALFQKSTLMSIPFLGTILTAYAWGYISDTKGRKFSLMIGIPVGFVLSTLSAFSPNWIVFAVLRFIGSCFTCCSQSVVYTLLGESCPEKIKGKYLIFLSSAVQETMPVTYCLSYLIGNLDFTYDLGFIKFLPWRLYTIALAFPMGIGVLLLIFLFESPKFLLNNGRDEEALNILRKIHRCNNWKSEIYPVSNLFPNEEDNDIKENVSFLHSLKEQTFPLFRPPLLLYTLLLFYYGFIIFGILYFEEKFGTLKSLDFFYIIFCILKNFFQSRKFLPLGSISIKSCKRWYCRYFKEGLCSVITQNSTINKSDVSSCEAIDLATVLVAVIAFNIYFIISFVMSTFARRRRVLLLILMFTGLISSNLAIWIPHKVSGVIYFGIFSIGLGTGPVFSYYVDLFPTSVRGMAACLGVMMGRISSMVTVYLVGSYITAHCTATFYIVAAFFLSGAVLTIILPPDKEDKIEQTKL